MRKIISNNLFMLKYIFKCCPSQFVITLIFSIINCVNYMVNALMTKYIFDSLEKQEKFESMLLLVLMTIIVSQILGLISKALTKWMVSKNRYRLHCAMQLELFKKTMSMRFESYDDPIFFDRFNIAISQADTRAIEVLNSFTSMTSALLSIVGIISILALMSPILIGLTFCCVLFSITLQCISYRTAHSSMEETELPNRRMEYIQRMFYQRNLAQEIRLNSCIFDVIKKEYRNAVDEMLIKIRKYAPRLFMIDVGDGVISSVVRGASICYLIYGVLNGKMTVGTYAAASNACSQLYDLLGSIFQSCFQFYNHSLYIDNYRAFLEQDNEMKEKFEKFPEKITSIYFRDVGYIYPGQNKIAVEKITININTGSKTAIVGDNGSGKSTIVKLLAGLYSPTEGEILLNGMPLRRFNFDDYIHRISVVPQDYQIFALSIAENIIMKPYTVDYEQSIWDALEFVGLKNRVKSMPHGIHTILTREFDAEGLGLSGGEMQRLVIARAFVKHNSILILDEPTSSLDKETSYNLTKKIMDLKDKTVVVVTHDPNLVELADTIIKIENGKVASKTDKLKFNKM